MYFSFTLFSFMGISSNSEFSLPKHHQKETNSQIPSSPTLNSSIGSSNPPSNHQTQQLNHTEDSISSVFLKTESELADDNDGFRTPTSLDNKIPVTKQCPPAPRKNRATQHFSSRKRKLESPRIRKNLQLDLTDEIESMFPPSLKENLGRRIKKARREDD